MIKKKSYNAALMPIGQPATKKKIKYTFYPSNY